MGAGYVLGVDPEGPEPILILSIRVEGPLASARAEAATASLPVSYNFCEMCSFCKDLGTAFLHLTSVIVKRLVARFCAR